MHPFKILLFIFLFFCFTNGAQAEIVNTTEDSYTAKDFNTTNYGNEQQLDIRSSFNYTYLKFNVTNYTSNATLYIYPEYCSATGIVEAYLMSSEWNESTITFDNPPTSQYTDWPNRYIVNITSTTPQWYAINLGSNLSRPGMYSIRLDTQTGRVYKFNSSENGINVAYLNVTPDQYAWAVENNKTDSNVLAFTVNTSECVQFSILADSLNVTNYTWYVNKTDQNNNQSIFNFTTPQGDGWNPSSEIWEIRTVANYTNGTNLTREWLLSSLNESEAPDYIEYFIDMNCYMRTGGLVLDPWGRELPTYVVNGNYASKGVLTGTSSSNTATFLFMYDYNMTYGTFKLKCHHPDPVAATTHFGFVSDNFKNIWFSWELKGEEMHDYCEVANPWTGTDDYYNYIPIAERWLGQAPSAHYWTTNPGHDANGDQIYGDWKEYTIIHTADDWWYIYDDDRMVPGCYQHIDGVLEHIEALKLFSSSTNQLDCIEIYNNTYIFPQNRSYYGSYPKWTYTDIYDTSHNFQIGAYEDAIISEGRNLTLQEISEEINNESLMTYDPYTRTATIKTNLTLIEGGEISVLNETLLFDTSAKSLDINLRMHSTFRVENSTISTIGNNPIRWNLASCISQTIFNPRVVLRAPQNFTTGGMAYLDRCEAKYEFRGRFIIQNSTVNNTCNLFLDAANEIVLNNVVFSNHSDSNYGDYTRRGNYVGHNNLKIQATGDKAIWVVPRMDLAEFTINNISFPNPKSELNFKVVGGEWLFNSTTIENCNLSNVDIFDRKANKTVYFVTYYNLTEHSDFSVLNCKLNESKLFVETNKAILETKYYADVIVTDASGTPISNAIITPMASNDDYGSENLYKWDWYVSDKLGPGAKGAMNYTANESVPYQGGLYKRWYNAQPLRTATTNANGRTSLPSENVNNSIVFTDKVFTNDAYNDTNPIGTTNQTSESITYNLTINTTGYSNITLDNIDPDQKWYRPNKDQSNYTITGVINNSNNPHITGFAPSPKYNTFNPGDTVKCQVWANETLTNTVWKVNNVEVQNNSSTTYEASVSAVPMTVSVLGTTANGTVSQEWVINNVTTDEVTLPTANFTSNVTSGTTPLTVQFNDTSTGSPISWYWDFGDGTNNTVQNATHTFTSAGNYTVNLTATNANGSSSKLGYITTINTTTNDSIVNHPYGTDNAYIPCYNNNTVAVVDTSTNTITQYIPVQSHPHGVAVNSAGTRAYVTSLGSNSISIINTTSNTVITNISVGNQPYGVAVNKAGTKVYVTNKDGNSVSVINTTSNTVSSTITGFTSPYGVVFTPDGSKAYVMHNSSVSIINTSDDTQISTNLTSYKWVAISPDGTTLYIPIKSLNLIRVVNTSTNELITNITGLNNVYGIAISPNGERLYTTAYSGTSVTIYNLTSNTKITSVVTGGTVTEGLSVNSDGTAVYISNLGSNNVSVLNTSDNTISASIEGFNQSYAHGIFIRQGIEPTANFTSNVTSGTTPLTVQFNDTSTGSPISWYWDFGDGTNNTVQNATHTFTSAGNYTVNLTATNYAGYSINTKTNLINVTLSETQTIPTITWSNPTNIAYGTALSGTQNNATASVVGTFVYSPANGTILSAGTHTLSVTFTPTDITNYTTATANVTLNVTKSTPVITWNNPSNITYGTTLSGTQNNATANTAGTFIYNPINGTILGVGSHTLNVTFTPTDTTNYTNATASVTLNVTKATSTITWNNPENITNGTALSSTQLNAEANIAGVFSYDPASDTILSVGDNQRLNCTFTPTDTANYTNATASAYINVITKSIPVITWNTPTTIIYGTALSGTQNSATANVPGAFTYNPINGTVLAAGTRTLNVTFVPTDITNYTNATKSVSLTVNKASTLITWSNPSNITYGTALSGTQNNAAANVSGTFAYNPTNGTILGVGTRTLNVTFTPTDNTNYSSSTASMTLNVTKATPTITWDNPANITNGTALSGTQLNAEADAAGTFVYNPVSGTVLTTGNNQTLNCTFTPTDTTNYTNTTASVHINVTSKITPTITWSNPSNITYGTALSGTQNGATASVPGTFVYSPVNNTILAAGTQTLNVTFTPTDTTNYTNATKSVTLNVTKAATTVTWNNPENITYGTALSGTQLNATGSVAGSMSYNKTSGTILPAGINVIGVTFTPTDSTNYSSSTKSVTINVTKATPVISWNNPAGISNGTALSGTQLNANANTAGTFVYDPASGIVLSIGIHMLNTTFTPTDSTNYTTATKSVNITVSAIIPVANFVGNVTSGEVPFAVRFTDGSDNTPTAWSWDFGDDGTSNVQNPVHVYTTAGTYAVELTAANAAGSDTETKINYITATEPEPEEGPSMVTFHSNASVNATVDNVIVRNNSIRLNDNSVWSNMSLQPDNHINITIVRWDTTNDHTKVWNESSTVANTVTNHIITGYPANTWVDIYRDGSGYDSAKTNATGTLNWTYDGGYSEHIFETRLSETQLVVSGADVVIESDVIEGSSVYTQIGGLYSTVTDIITSGYTLAALMVLALGGAIILRALGYI